MSHTLSRFGFAMFCAWRHSCTEVNAGTGCGWARAGPARPPPQALEQLFHALRLGLR